jgi:mevalonate kinase
VITLRGNEIVGIYLLLKREDPDDSEPLAELMGRIETYLFQHLSIAEIEKLEELYEKNIDVLESKR